MVTKTKRYVSVDIIQLTFNIARNTKLISSRAKQLEGAGWYLRWHSDRRVLFTSFSEIRNLVFMGDFAPVKNWRVARSLRDIGCSL